MTIAHIVLQRSLALAAVIAGGIALAGPALAGSCPSDKLRSDGSGEKMNATPAKDVSDAVLTQIDLAKTCGGEGSSASSAPARDQAWRRRALALAWQPSSHHLRRAGRNRRIREHLRCSHLAPRRRDGERNARDVALLAKPDGFASPLQPQPLYQERFVIACSAGHPFARRNVVRIADLDGEPYLARINCEYFDALRDVCHANGSRLVGSFRSEREDWILTMVAAGMGISFLPEFSTPFQASSAGTWLTRRSRGRCRW